MMWDSAPTVRFVVPRRLLVLAQATAAAVLAPAPPPLVLAEAAAAAVTALKPQPLVLTEAAAAAVLAPVPLPLVLAETVVAAVLVRAPPPPVFAEVAAAAVMVLSPPPLVLTEDVAAAVLAPAPPPLVLAETAAAAVMVLVPLPLVFAEDRVLAGFLGYRRIWRRRCGWRQAQCVGWVHITLVVFAALVLWPAGCVPLIQQSLLSLRGNLRTINVIRHPVLHRILGDFYPVKDAVGFLAPGSAFEQARVSFVCYQSRVIVFFI